MQIKNKGNENQYLRKTDLKKKLKKQDRKL
jgi:hypothetical protein